MILVRLTLLLIAAAMPAQAHGTLPGGGGFYSGALHPLVAIEHLLLLLAAGLILGRDDLRRPLLALGLGVGAGLWFGTAVASQQIVLLGVTLGFGTLLALQLKQPEWIYTALLLVAGLAVGLETDLPASNARMAALGVGVGVFLITMNAFALGAALISSRVAVTLRVAGAWMLAVSMMVLALNLRGLA